MPTRAVKHLESQPLLVGAANGNANGGIGSSASAYVVDTLLQVVPGATAGASAWCCSRAPAAVCCMCHAESCRPKNLVAVRMSSPHSNVTCSICCNILQVCCDPHNTSCE